MKISFDTLGTERPDKQYATPEQLEMTDQMVNKALRTCLTIRKMLGDVVGYVEVLKVRLHFSYKYNWVGQKEGRTVSPVWFTIGGMLSFGDRKIPIHREKAEGPILYGSSTKQDACSIVSCIICRLEGMLEYGEKDLEKLVSALKTAKSTTTRK